jgi:hypothetical protein
VPLSVYYSIDELFRRTDGLAALQGASRAAVSAAKPAGLATTGTTSGGSKNPPETQNVAFDYVLAPDSAAGANPFSFKGTVPTRFSIRGFTILVESSSGSGTTAIPFLYVGGEEVLTTATNAATSFLNAKGTHYNANVIIGQQGGEERVFDPGQTVQIKLTGASPTARVGGTLELTLKVPVG